MATLRCEVVTVERIVYQGDVDIVLAPGIEGQLGILPKHAPLITALTEGELIIRKEGEEDVNIAIGGGFLEVNNNKVTILADTAERAEEIDEARAAAARKRAEEALRERRLDAVEFAKAEAALRRSLVRLKVAARRRGAKGEGSRAGHELG
jgi:F-type H+-transporting ATPase subunit epsilon